MSLRVPLVILEVINVITVTCSIHLHRLKEKYKVFEVRVPIDSENISESHGASTHIPQTHHDKVQDCSKLGVLGIGKPHTLEQVYVKLGWQASILF